MFCYVCFCGQNNVWGLGRSRSSVAYARCTTALRHGCSRGGCTQGRYMARLRCRRRRRCLYHPAGAASASATISAPSSSCPPAASAPGCRRCLCRRPSTACPCGHQKPALTRILRFGPIGTFGQGLFPIGIIPSAKKPICARLPQQQANKQTLLPDVDANNCTLEFYKVLIVVFKVLTHRSFFVIPGTSSAKRRYRWTMAILTMAVWEACCSE